MPRAKKTVAKASAAPVPAPTPPVPPTTPPIVVQPATAALCFTLLHPTLHCTRYDFQPAGDTVVVKFTSSRDNNIYSVPLAEARGLWKRLKAQGYEEF